MLVASQTRTVGGQPSGSSALWRFVGAFGQRLCSRTPCVCEHVCMMSARLVMSYISLRSLHKTTATPRCHHHRTGGGLRQKREGACMEVELEGGGVGGEVEGGREVELAEGGCEVGRRCLAHSSTEYIHIYIHTHTPSIYTYIHIHPYIYTHIHYTYIYTCILAISPHPCPSFYPCVFRSSWVWV